MVFPGQGSQSVGMLQALVERYSEMKQTFADVSETLDYDLWQLMQIGPIEELNKTWQTQPAILAASVAIYRIWQEKQGAEPAAMAGHSLGEYSALVCAGVLDLKEAVKLVEVRGRLMQNAVSEGTGSMYAIIGLDGSTVRLACEQASQGEIVAPVNFNSPSQIVIAGHKEAVLRAAENCKVAGAKRVVPLPVSVPSHCELMKSAADKLAVVLDKVTFSTPKIPVFNNVNAKIEKDPSAIKQALIEQLYSPVRWSEIVEKIAKKDIKLLIEVGPGKVLTGLAKRIVKTLDSIAINDPDSLDMALAATK